MIPSCLIRPQLGRSCARQVHQISRAASGCKPPTVPAAAIASRDGEMCLMMQRLNLREQQRTPSHYILPTLESAISKAILDPLCSNVAYKLPSFSREIVEKFSPALLNIVPIEDPAPHPGITIEKHAMPWLMRVRHKKMKKHKLKKFRKRNIFLHRRLAQARRQKKEALMVNYEKSMTRFASDFSAEEYISSRIDTAKRGGWGIDPLLTWKAEPQSPEPKQ